MVQIMYLEIMETTMGRLGIREKKSVILSPLHIKVKKDVYIGSDESNTIRSEKMGVSNKETVIYNYYQKLVTKNQG